MAETEHRSKQESDAWLLWDVTETEWQEALLRAEDAEMTRVPPLLPFLLGALSAVAIVLVLALASL